MAANFVSIGAHFERTGELIQVGGSQYLAQLLLGTRPTLSAREYARGIHDLWVERAQQGRSLPPPPATPAHEVAGHG
jgi:replicative DNA helicase